MNSGLEEGLKALAVGGKGNGNLVRFGTQRVMRVHDEPAWNSSPEEEAMADGLFRGFRDCCDDGMYLLLPRYSIRIHTVVSIHSL